MYIFTYLYILPEISAYHLQLKCMGGHFFSGPSLHREYYSDIARVKANERNDTYVWLLCGSGI